MNLPYKVHRSFGRDEKLCAAFEDLNDAKLFIQERMAKDAPMKLQNPPIYRIYDRAMEVVEEFDPSKMSSSAGQANVADESSAGGQSKGQSFRPSPLQTTLRPTGMPQNWRKDNEDEKKK